METKRTERIQVPILYEIQQIAIEVSKHFLSILGSSHLRGVTNGGGPQVGGPPTFEGHCLRALGKGDRVSSPQTGGAL